MATTLRRRTPCHQLPLLLQELHRRRWTLNLTGKDVSRILNSDGKLVDATVREALSQKLFQQKTATSFIITRLGHQAIQRAGQRNSYDDESRTSQATDQSSFLRPEHLDSDSRANTNSRTDSKTDSRVPRIDNKPHRGKPPLAQVVNISSFSEPLADSRNSTSEVTTEGSCLTSHTIQTDDSSVSSNEYIGTDSKTNSRNADSRKKPKKPRKPTKAQLAARAAKLEKQEHAKQVMKATREGKKSTQLPSRSIGLDEMQQQHKAYAIALAYEEQLCHYTAKPYLRVIKGIPKTSDKGFNTWLRAALQADELGVSYAFYVKAQFYWFDKWFSKAPKPHELASYKTKINAKERVRLYEVEVSKGQTNPKRKILSKVRTSPSISRSIRFSYSERTLSTLMKNYGATEEDIFRTFAKGAQASVYFDKAWLKQNETYLKLARAGEL